MGIVVLSAPKKNVIELPIGSVINLDGDDLGSGTLQLLNEADNSVVDQTWTVTSTPTGQIGPYGSTRKFSLKANTGNISYIITVTPGDLSPFKEELAANGGGGGGAAVDATSPLVKVGNNITLPAATTSSPGHMTAAQARAIDANTQAIATKQNAPAAPNAVTAARTLVAADNGTTLYNNTANAYAITVPSGLPIGFGVQLVQKSTGAISVVAGSGAAVVSADNFTKTGGVNKSIVIYNSGIANDYIIGGQGAV